MDSLPSTPDTQAAGSLSDAGAAMRDRAVAALERRHAELLERSKHRQLTGLERSEVNRLGAIIDTLQSFGGPCAT